LQFTSPASRRSSKPLTQIPGHKTALRYPAGRPEPDRIEEYPEKGNALSNNPIAGTGHRRPKVASVGHNKLPEIRIV